jgi:hypothetical protein
LSKISLEVSADEYDDVVEEDVVVVVEVEDDVDVSSFRFLARGGSQAEVEAELAAANAA